MRSTCPALGETKRNVHTVSSTPDLLLHGHQGGRVAFLMRHLGFCVFAAPILILRPLRSVQAIRK